MIATAGKRRIYSVTSAPSCRPDLEPIKGFEAQYQREGLDDVVQKLGAIGDAARKGYSWDMLLNVINGLVAPYMGDGTIKLSAVSPTSTITLSDGLASVFRALGVTPVDIDALLDPTGCDDEAKCTPAKLRAKYVSDFIAAMFADIQKGAVGQCDCETACAPLTSFQPDNFKTYYDEAVPPQWIWEGIEDTRSDEFPACRAITAKATNDGYEILDEEEAGSTVRTPGRLRIRRAPRRPRTDPPLPPAPGRVRVPGRRRVPPDHDRHVRAPHADEGPPPVVQVLEGNERVRARQPSAGGVRPVRHRLRGVEDGVRNLRYLVRQSLRRPGDAHAVREGAHSLRQQRLSDAEN